MERKQAVEYLTEIITESGLVPEAFSIINPSAKDSSSGYKITIASSDKEIRKKIKSVTEKYNLDLNEEKGQVIIFKRNESIVKPC